MGDDSQKSASSSSSTTWSWGTSATLGASAFILLRLMAITDYDWETAFGLSDSINFDDAISIVMGTFLGVPDLTVGLLVLLLPLWISGHLHELRRGAWALTRLLVLISMALVFTAAIITFRMWWAPTLAIAWLGVLLVIHWRGRGLERFLAMLAARMGSLTFGGVLLIAAVSDEVWVSEERISLGDRVVYGYVIENGSQFLTVLTADTRQKIVLLSREVTARDGVD